MRQIEHDQRRARWASGLMTGGLLAYLILAISGGVAMAQTNTTEEVPSVEGAANPLEAPTLSSGSVVDTILQTETLWYGVDAQPGQLVGATVAIVGRPDDPEAADTFLQVSLTDQQRQPLEQRDQGFSGLEDAVIEIPPVEMPAIDGDLPLLSLALTSASGATDLAGVGYRLVLTILIDGDPVPLPPDSPDTSTSSAASPQPDVTVTSEPNPEPGPPNVVADLIPVALVALAVGGFAGFELSRRGL